jgi:hypothetical protein
MFEEFFFAFSAFKENVIEGDGPKNQTQSKMDLYETTVNAVLVGIDLYKVLWGFFVDRKFKMATTTGHSLHRTLWENFRTNKSTNSCSK